MTYSLCKAKRCFLLFAWDSWGVWEEHRLTVFWTLTAEAKQTLSCALWTRLFARLPEGHNIVYVYNKYYYNYVLTNKRKVLRPCCLILTALCWLVSLAGVLSSFGQGNFFYCCRIVVVSEWPNLQTWMVSSQTGWGGRLISREDSEIEQLSLKSLFWDIIPPLQAQGFCTIWWDTQPWLSWQGKPENSQQKKTRAKCKFKKSYPIQFSVCTTHDSWGGSHTNQTGSC